MKIILGGWEGSKKIISASSYLVNKYLGKEFDVTYLNVGPFEGKLFCGKYVDLGGEHLTKQQWPNAIANYLDTLDDDLIIFGDDDFFLSKPFNSLTYRTLLSCLERPEIVCAKLYPSFVHQPSEYETIQDDVFLLNQNAEYTAVVQYCLWKRKVFVNLLHQAKDPWDFEGMGSLRLNKIGRVVGSLNGSFIYPDRSAVSQTHPGKVSVLGNQVKDIEELITMGYLKKEDLIMGLWAGDVMTYEEGKKDQYKCLEGHYDHIYHKRLLDLLL